MILPVLAALASAFRPAFAAGDMFPPVERILRGVPPPVAAPAARAELDLRDSLGAVRDQVWLRAELRSADWRRRRDAAAQAGRPGNLPAVPYLGATLLQLSEHPRVRVAAAVSLARIRDHVAARYLEKALRDPEVEVRFAAALGLGRAAAEGSETRLERALQGDESWWVRYAAAVALGALERPFAVGALARSAAEDPAWQVRLQAAKSLGQIRSAGSAQALLKPLSDEDPGVRAAAAMALGEVGPDAVEVLQDALPREADPFQRGLLAASLRKALKS